MKIKFLIIIILLISFSCNDPSSDGKRGDLTLLTVRVGGYNLLVQDLTKVPASDRISFSFSCPVDTTGIRSNISIISDEGPVTFELSTFDENMTISAILDSTLEEGKSYRIIVSEKVRGECGIFEGIDLTFKTLVNPMELIYLKVGENEADYRLNLLTGLGIRPEIEMKFSAGISKDEISRSVTFRGSLPTPSFLIEQMDPSTFKLKFNVNLEGYRKYSLTISDRLVSENGKPFKGAMFDVYTDGDSTYKFPEISNEELLTRVQEQTFKYFWDFAHPVSGLTRERNTSGDLVTIGGSGFGVMSIIVGIERGFITRQEGISRLNTIVNFLGNEADRFHGAWPHWLSGSTGDVIPFSSDDDGGDLVETAFMIQGLYTVRQFLDESDLDEAELISNINALVDEVEWDWYTQGGQDVLYWHWSPEYGWQKNMKITGWNEALIIYVLAASSTTHTIEKEVYEEGWARNGDIRNTAGREYFGYQLPLRSDMGGPLFFAHYSFLGLDPRNLQDQYANYWTQNVNHTKINRAYCIANPKNYAGYSEKCWGLTASDGNTGYSAHSPNNDRGVITPTAAISSLPYTPEKSMEAIRFFYYILGDKIWGVYGFNDAFNVTADWYADSYIAIDQGPIICMIENYRTGKLWELFMSAPEIQDGLTKLGFTY